VIGVSTCSESCVDVPVKAVTAPDITKARDARSLWFMVDLPYAKERWAMSFLQAN
jgi:hypothetical protein